MTIRRFVGFLRTLAVFGLMLASARADDAADAAVPNPGWRVSLGGGGYASPDYPGAKNSRTYPIPYQDIDYRDRFFSTGFDFLGVYLVKNAMWKAGFDLAYDPTWRHHGDDPRLLGLKDIDATVRIRAFAQVTHSFLTFSVDAAQDILGQKQGLIADADLYASLPVGAALFSVGSGITWSNGRYMRTFFGITPEQAEQSTFPQYAASSGISDWHANAIATYSFSKQWQAIGTLTWSELRGSASDSPIVERRQQLEVIAVLTYRFR